MWYNYDRYIYICIYIDNYIYSARNSCPAEISGQNKIDQHVGDIHQEKKVSLKLDSYLHYTHLWLMRYRWAMMFLALFVKSNAIFSGKVAKCLENGMLFSALYIYIIIYI